MARKANSRKGWTVTREQRAEGRRSPWMASVYRAGTRERRRFLTKEEATAWAQARCVELAADGVAAGELSDVERRSALAARRWLAEGETLEEVARELAECRKELGEDAGRGAVLAAVKEWSAARETLAGRASVEAAAEWWARHHPNGADRTLGELADAYLRKQRAEGNSPSHVRAVRSKLARLMGDSVAEQVAFKSRRRTEGAEREESAAAVRRREVSAVFAGFGRDRLVADVTRADLLGLLARLEEKGYSAGTMRSWRVLLKSLFRFASAEWGIETAPAENLGKVKVETGVPEFLSAADAEKILRAAERVAPECVCGVAILFFAGVRPFELVGQYALPREVERANGTREQVAGGMLGGLEWRDVDIDGGFIRLTVTKTTQARLVPMSDNLRAWLRCWGGEKREGRVVKNPTTWKRAKKRIEEAAEGARWGHDLARHSFATFHLAMHGDRNLLEEAMGHTVGSKVLETAYKGLATRKEAEKYWGIMPSAATASDV